jgi:competence ComEA-like helix-hairpin-helix protein
MVSFTHQEKIAIIFLVTALFCGSLFLLIQKKHPVLFAVFTVGAPEKFYKKINIHTASQTEWEFLPGIGAYRAAMIVETRSKKGGFKSISDVRYVKGIGPVVFNQIRDRLIDE